MVTVSFAENLRGRAGSAASLSSRVIPTEASNPCLAASPAEPSNAAAPIPPAACRINSLRFITPPSTHATYRFGRPSPPAGYHRAAGHPDILGFANVGPAALIVRSPIPAGSVIRHQPFPSPPLPINLTETTS